VVVIAYDSPAYKTGIAFLAPHRYRSDEFRPDEYGRQPLVRKTAFFSRFPGIDVRAYKEDIMKQMRFFYLITLAAESLLRGYRQVLRKHPTRSARPRQLDRPDELP